MAADDIPKTFIKCISSGDKKEHIVAMTHMYLYVNKISTKTTNTNHELLEHKHTNTCAL